MAPGGGAMLQATEPPAMEPPPIVWVSPLWVPVTEGFVRAVTYVLVASMVDKLLLGLYWEAMLITNDSLLEMGILNETTRSFYSLSYPVKWMVGVDCYFFVTSKSKAGRNRKKDSWQ